MAATSVPVSQRSVMARINRVLSQSDERLMTARSARTIQDCGEFYVVDVRRNFLAAKNIDVVKLAKELACLKPYERIAD